MLACIYNFYKRFEKGDPYYTAIALTSFSQILAVLFMLMILRYYFGFNSTLYKKTALIFSIGILWQLINFKYYNRGKVSLIIHNYNGKSAKGKYIWGAITIISLFVPFITLFVLFA